MCNAPKRSNRRESRTGFAGGYNERERDVEYKKKRDSDDEYDDFGRKRRKREDNKSVFKRWAAGLFLFRHSRICSLTFLSQTADVTKKIKTIKKMTPRIRTKTMMLANMI